MIPAYSVGVSHSHFFLAATLYVVVRVFHHKRGACGSPADSSVLARTYGGVYAYTRSRNRHAYVRATSRVTPLFYALMVAACGSLPLYTRVRVCAWTGI